MDANQRSLIEAALEAPSGENAQPWRFRAEAGSISMYHNPGSDESLYNYNGYGQMVCEGAAIENMLAKADGMGLNVRLETQPDPSYPNLIAKITFAGTKTPAHTELSNAIPSRTTNRKPYKKTALTAEEGSALEAAFADFKNEGLRFVRITDRKAIARLARVGSTNEEIMLGNEELHSFFFSHLTWTKAEDQKKKLGFYIKTLELPPPIELLFKAFRSWKVMQVLKKLHFPKLVGKGNGDIYAASAEIGVIAIPELSSKYLLLAGRAFERIWLTAESRGLSIQPLTGTLFMQIFASNVPEGHFSPAERKLLTEKTAEVYETAGVSGGAAVVMYRIGRASKPSARATRFTLEELMI